MARSKTMTPGELRSAKAVLKQELGTHNLTVKSADRAIKEAEKAHLANAKAADKALADATKAHAVAVKASLKTFDSVRKEQSKLSGGATTATAKITAKLQALEGAETAPAPKAKKGEAVEA